MKQKKASVIHLPRGGKILKTSLGSIQVGAPPETVKDSMKLSEGVPSYFCIPSAMFHKQKGISLAEIEFPIYFNFFIRQKKTSVICTKSQKKLLKKVLKESLIGPRSSQYDLRDFGPYTADPDLIETLQKEASFFRAGRSISDMVEFCCFTDGFIKIENVEISLINDRYLKFRDTGFFNGSVKIDSRVEYKPSVDLGKRLDKAFEPPPFGITCLGTSHGFDPDGNASGFILWINEKGIMIDPPVNSTEWLNRSGVSPRLIDAVILTHVHADHDAGTLQKVLEQDKIKLYTTRTVLHSWMRKYGALTGLKISEFKKLFDFVPIETYTPINVHGALFRFHYSLHSIPTIGFRVKFLNRRFAYSSDHLNLKRVHDRMLKENVITKERYGEFQNFPWESPDMIFHEAGIAPLHTPLDVLNAMPLKIKKKVFIYHIAEKDFKKTTGLRLARFGTGCTEEIPVEGNAFQTAYNVIEFLNKIPLFEGLSVKKMKDLLAECVIENYSPGSTIIQKGDPGEFFYVISKGQVVIGKSAKNRKHLSAGQSFGEVALVLNTNRTVSVFAETETSLLKLHRSSFKRILSGTPAYKKLIKISESRSQESWETLVRSPSFFGLTDLQATEFELLLERFEVEDDMFLHKKSNPVKTIYIYCKGSVQCGRKEASRCSFKKGDLTVPMEIFRNRSFAPFDVKAGRGAVLYMIEPTAFRRFIDRYPGVSFRLGKTATR